tara:strand:- start:545 stop:823 length:279 start_codon:yes stop_codon:yes gene_type:complete
MITFKEFVESFPAESVMDHSTWKSCAVGLYFKHIKADLPAIFVDEHRDIYEDSPEGAAIKATQAAILSTSLAVINTLEWGNIETFGELAEML